MVQRDRQLIAAFTGHRPEGCEDEETVRRKLREELRRHPGLTTVITGMASGVDLWGAAEARDLGLEIWCAKPWKGHGPRKADEELYHSVIRSAALVHNVNIHIGYPGPWVYHARNEWMVDNSDLLIAYWSGKKSGGTYACIEYAKKVERDFVNVY